MEKTNQDPDEVFNILYFENPPDESEKTYGTAHFAQSEDKDFGFLTMSDDPRYVEASRLYIFTPDQSEKMDEVIKVLDEVMAGDGSELKYLLVSGSVKKVETEIPVDKGGSMHKFKHCLLIKHDNEALRKIITIIRDEKLIGFPPNIENWFATTSDVKK